MGNDSKEENSNRLAEIIGECYSHEDLAEWLGMTPEELEQARSSRQYLAVETSDGKWFYPAFQFLPGTNATLPGLNEILLTLTSGIKDEWTHALWLIGEVEYELNGKSVHQWLLNDGDIEVVMRLARIDAASWSGR